MFLFNFRITCKEKFNMVLYVIYVSNIPVIQGIFKIISFREKRKAKRHLSSSSLLTSKDRSRYRLGENANPHAPWVIRRRKISPEKRNPPRSPVDGPGGEERKNPRRHPQKVARSRGCVILKSVPLVARLTPSTRPARGAKRAHESEKKGTRKREGI